MASDVEVLREILRAIEGEWNAAGPMARLGEGEVVGPWMTTLSRLIAALEAREAQPKAEGRLSDNAFEGACIGGDGLAREARRARASEAVLREIYLPLSVRNGGSEGLARYYRQTRDLIAKLQQDLRAWEAKWLQEKMEHKKTADQVTYWKERADIEAGEVAALSERVAALEAAIRPFVDEHEICKPGMCSDYGHVVRMEEVLHAK